MPNLYEVRYERKSAKESKVADKSNVYSEGHFRTVNMFAGSEKEAIEIAERVLAKQFADKPADDPELEAGDVAVVLGGVVYVDPINAQSNYKLQGVVKKETA